MSQIQLSVIIPTHNRAHRIGACLAALDAQTQPAGDFEVIVVADGSTDGTEDQLRARQTGYTLRVLSQPKSGQHLARNHGAAAAAGRYLLFIDDDVLASPRLVAEHLSAQRAESGVLALGQLTVEPAAAPDWFARSFAEEWVRHFQTLSDGLRAPFWLDCWGGNFSVPRDAFLQIGGFATDLLPSEDTDIGYRLEEHGLRVVYLPDAIGAHDERKGLAELVADTERHGGAAVELYRRHPAVLPWLLGWFHHVGSRGVLARRILLALRVPPRWIGWAGPLLGSRISTERWYRFVREYAYWRGVRAATGGGRLWQQLTHGTPILMYHAFGRPGEQPTRYVIPSRRFKWQMFWLKLAGYQVIGLDEFVGFRREHRLPPPRSVVLTIDDGYKDAYEVAFPVLKRRGFTATVFVVSGHVGGANRWDADGRLRGRRLMSWPELGGMILGGLRVGAHTRTHAHLSSLDPGAAREEVVASRDDLEARLGVAVRTFAYPYGERDPAIEALVKEADFSASCGASPGLNLPTAVPCVLQRTEIDGMDSLVGFARKVRTGRVPPPQRRASLTGPPASAVAMAEPRLVSPPTEAP